MTTNTRIEVVALLGVVALIGFSGLAIRESLTDGDIGMAIVRGMLVPGAALWEFVRVLGRPGETDVAARMTLVVAFALAMGLD